MHRPRLPGRLKALRARGGTLVVVDPRRTRTAKLADRHLAPRPGSDALLLAALAHTLLAEKLAAPGALEERTDGLGELAEALGSFTPEAVAPACDLTAAEIRDLARELAAAPTAAVYGRIGSCTVEYGTLASWLVDVLNTLTGNLDRPGESCSRSRPPARGRALPGPARASPSAAGAAGSAATPRPRRNCPSPPWPRRSRRRGRGGSAP